MENQSRHCTAQLKSSELLMQRDSYHLTAVAFLSIAEAASTVPAAAAAAILS
jgi:hypothetical protein